MLTVVLVELVPLLGCTACSPQRPGIGWEPEGHGEADSPNIDLT